MGGGGGFNPLPQHLNKMGRGSMGGGEYCTVRNSMD